MVVNDVVSTTGIVVVEALENVNAETVVVDATTEVDDTIEGNNGEFGCFEPGK